MDFDPLNWIVMPIFLVGLAKIFFGGSSSNEEPKDERWGPGYYGSREEAERHGAHHSSSYSGHEYSYYDSGPGHYD